MSTILPNQDTAKNSTSSRRLSSSERWTRIGIALVVLVAILGGAWAIGGKEGFSNIGRGGINRSLLPKVGQPAPDFTTYDVNGNPVSLSNFRGHPVWLNFWGSWCPPCRSEMPDAEAAYQQLAPKGLVMLAVSLKEPPQDAAAFAAKNHATFTILSDQYLEHTGYAYPIANFPTHFFIDSSGIIRRVVLSDLSEKDAVEYGNDLIAQSS
jgi:cytochrome c biogenesis protein CcmG, thiol:disulfide interchange protein DsbE